MTKRCQQCGREYSEDYSFCLEDGSLLVNAQPAPRTTTEEETRVLKVVDQPTPKTNWMVPAAIGLLALAIVGLAGVLLMRSGDDKRSEKPEVAAAEPARTSEPLKNTSTQQLNALPRTNTPAANVQAQPPAPSLGGKWVGDWSTATGAYLKFDLTLDDSNGRVDGRIDWKLIRSPRPDKQSKIGFTAVEYVTGQYDPVTRVLTMRGVRKDDPNDMLVMLDQYRLNLSQNGETLSGTARNGGKWNGRINLSR